MTLSLPDVTLCAVTSVNHELTVRAMKECLKHCSFADVVMVSSQPVEAPFRVEVIPPFAGIEYASFIFKNLTKYTPSAFNLLVQYDGYVVDPSAWSDRFYDCDYIGAKWPWFIEDRRVGNSGFCFRSKKLLDVMSEMDLPPTGEYVDDKYICHTKRNYLEKNFGIKIATEDVADLFAYERHTPDQPTFGFHGIFNFWRHTDDAEMEKIPSLFENYNITSRAYAEILFHYHDARKPNVFYKWYDRLRTQIGVSALKNHLLQYLKDAAFIDTLIMNGENMSSDGL